MTEPTKSYSPRTWNTYDFATDATSEDSFEYDFNYDLTVCHSDSEMARRIGDRISRFCLDLELVAAGLDPYCPAHVGRLTKAWKQHRPGSLVLFVTVSKQAGDFANLSGLRFLIAVEA